jgi:tetratricopeptide (TPR) repeat protein
MMGVIHHDRGRFEEARLCFEHALALNQRYTEAALNLVVTYNDLGRYEEAQTAYQRALEQGASGDGNIDPFARGKIANLHADLAQAYIDVGLSNEAVQEYRNAIRLCPDFADLRVRLAHLYRQTGDLPAAHYELGEAIRARPEYIPARVALGVVLFLSGQRDQAVVQWKQALEIAPDDKTASLYLRGLGAVTAPR